MRSHVSTKPRLSDIQISPMEAMGPGLMIEINEETPTGGGTIYIFLSPKTAVGLKAALTREIAAMKRS